MGRDAWEVKGSHQKDWSQKAWAEGRRSLSRTGLHKKVGTARMPLEHLEVDTNHAVRMFEKKRLRLALPKCLMYRGTEWMTHDQAEGL